jgi:hypothetical protein
MRGGTSPRCQTLKFVCKGDSTVWGMRFFHSNVTLTTRLACGDDKRAYEIGGCSVASSKMMLPTP